MKKLVCLVLGLTLLLSLAACQVDKNIGPEEPTTIVVNDIDFEGALARLNALDTNDPDIDAALKEAMERGVTIPDYEPPAETMPAPMPAGVPARVEDVYPLMENVRNIFSSGSYMLKARGSSPPSPGMPIGTTPITFAVSGGVSAFEASMDWTNMMRAMAEPGSKEYSMAVINGATMATFFGKRVRFVTKPEGSAVLFLDKGSYMQLPAGEDDDLGDNPMNMANMFGDMFKPDTQGPVTASKVTDGGREYLCGEIKGMEGAQLFYYFLNSELKRIEMKVVDPETGKTETVVFEVDLLTTQVDTSMFSTTGYKAMSFDEMAQAGEGGLGGLFGGF